MHPLNQPSPPVIQSIFVVDHRPPSSVAGHRCSFDRWPTNLDCLFERDLTLVVDVIDSSARAVTRLLSLSDLVCVFVTRCCPSVEITLRRFWSTHRTSSSLFWPSIVEFASSLLLTIHYKLDSFFVSRSTVFRLRYWCRWCASSQYYVLLSLPSSSSPLRRALCLHGFFTTTILHLFLSL